MLCTFHLCRPATTRCRTCAAPICAACPGATVLRPECHRCRSASPLLGPLGARLVDALLVWSFAEWALVAGTWATLTIAFAVRFAEPAAVMPSVWPLLTTATTTAWLGALVYSALLTARVYTTVRLYDEPRAAGPALLITSFALGALALGGADAFEHLRAWWSAPFTWAAEAARTSLWEHGRWVALAGHAVGAAVGAALLVSTLRKARDAPAPSPVDALPPGPSTDGVARTMLVAPNLALWVAVASFVALSVIGAARIQTSRAVYDESGARALEVEALAASGPDKLNQVVRARARAVEAPFSLGVVHTRAAVFSLALLGGAVVLAARAGAVGQRRVAAAGVAERGKAPAMFAWMEAHLARVLPSDWAVRPAFGGSASVTGAPSDGVLVVPVTWAATAAPPDGALFVLGHELVHLRRGGHGRFMLGVVGVWFVMIALPIMFLTVALLNGAVCTAPVVIVAWFGLRDVFVHRELDADRGGADLQGDDALPPQRDRAAWRMLMHPSAANRARALAEKSAGTPTWATLCLLGAGAATLGSSLVLLTTYMGGFFPLPELTITASAVVGERLIVVLAAACGATATVAFVCSALVVANLPLRDDRAAWWFVRAWLAFALGAANAGFAYAVVATIAAPFGAWAGVVIKRRFERAGVVLEPASSAAYVAAAAATVVVSSLFLVNAVLWGLALEEPGFTPRWPDVLAGLGALPLVASGLWAARSGSVRRVVAHLVLTLVAGVWLVGRVDARLAQRAAYRALDDAALVTSVEASPSVAALVDELRARATWDAALSRQLAEQQVLLEAGRLFEGTPKADELCAGSADRLHEILGARGLDVAPLAGLRGDDGWRCWSE